MNTFYLRFRKSINHLTLLRRRSRVKNLIQERNIDNKRIKSGKSYLNQRKKKNNNKKTRRNTRRKTRRKTRRNNRRKTRRNNRRNRKMKRKKKKISRLSLFLVRI